VLLIHGEGDANTFIANSQEMYQALHLRGKTVQYAHYPREGHGIGEPEHRLDEMRRILNWLDLYVIGGGRRQTYRIGDKIVQDGWELTVTQATLPTYAGRGGDKSRYVEVTLILRDTLETGRPLSITPADLAFARSSGKSPRRSRPVGLPIDVLGQAILAEGTGWRFDFQTPTGEKAINERGLAVPLAVTFRLGKAVGEHRFTYRDFPPVVMDVPPADDKDAEKKDEKKPTGDGPT
jgi:hypothetical protein